MRRIRAALQRTLLGLSAYVFQLGGTSLHAAPNSRVAKLRVPPPIKARRSPKPSAYSDLPPISVSNINSRKSGTLRLYTASGQVDESVAVQLDSLLSDARDPENIQTRTIDRRLLQLLFRAAYHFSSHHIDIVSAYRVAKGGFEGIHAQGHAVDFKLEGVKAPILAAYLRTIPRVGVGIYTHPKTQFVHLDVREHSFHWLDASPPRRHWREKNIGGKWLIVLDAKYTPKDDWPEGFTPP